MTNYGVVLSYASMDFSTNKDGIYDTLIEYLYDTPPTPGNSGFGTTEVYLDLTADSTTTPQQGDVFGVTAYFTNIFLGGTTYFKAPMTGTYTFTIEEASDAAVLLVFNQEILCCTNMDADNDPDKPTGWNMSQNATLIESDAAHSNPKLSIEFKEGDVYALSLAFLNLSGDAKLKLSVVFPDGQYVTDLAGYIGFPNGFDCANYHTTTKLYSDWNSDFATTYSTSIITHDMTTTTTLETVYYVLTPSAAPTPEPSSSEVPLTSEVPSTSEIPSASEVPSSSELPSISEIPSTSELPSSSEIESSLEPSSSSETPIVTEYPSSSEEPIITEYPSSSYEESTITSDASETESTTDYPESSSTVQILPSSEPDTDLDTTSTSVIAPSTTDTEYASSTDVITSATDNHTDDTSSVNPGQTTTATDEWNATETETTPETITATTSDEDSEPSPTEEPTTTTPPTSGGNSNEGDGDNNSGDENPGNGNNNNNNGNTDGNGSPDEGGHPDLTTTVDIEPTNGWVNPGAQATDTTGNNAGKSGSNSGGNPGNSGNNSGNSGNNSGNDAGNSGDSSEDNQGSNAGNSGNPGNNVGGTGSSGNDASSSSNSGNIANGGTSGNGSNGGSSNSGESNVEDGVNANANQSGTQVSQYPAASGNTFGAANTATYTANHVTTNIGPTASLYSPDDENGAAKSSIGAFTAIMTLLIFSTLFQV